MMRVVLVLVASLWVTQVSAMQPSQPPQEPPPQQTVAPNAQLERRVALVIGNSAYRHAPELPNPANDAKAVTAALEAAGFEVVAGYDLDRAGIDGTLRDFSRKVGAADVALFFYAGHGLQVGGRNYIVPVDAKLESERDLEFETQRLDFVLAQMELEREGKTSLVFLDACRNNPLTRSLARSMGTRSAVLGSGLAPIKSGVGTFIAFSTQPDNVALDGDGTNSPFTAALVRHLPRPGLSLTGLMIEVRREVIKATDGSQVPWDHSALTGQFFFHPATPGASGERGGSDGTAERLKRLEDELAREKARAETDRAARDDGKRLFLETRIKDLESAMRRTQQDIFAVQRKMTGVREAAERMERQKELSQLMIDNVQRGRELQALRQDLEALTGTNSAAANR